MKSIIFSGEMVRAILDGTKTQTRQVVNPQPMSIDTRANTEVPYNGTAEFLLENLKCPYGKVGDELYVRETFAEYPQEGCYIYKASEGEDLLKLGTDLTGCWTSPIHMPQRASRITLRITNVRVQRLQDISEADAEAEGASFTTTEGSFKAKTIGSLLHRMQGGSYLAGFPILWNKLCGDKYPWESNPFVWAITFEVKK